MPEVDLVFPRVHVEFADPADETQVFRCDLTWLTSSYMCIFGQGCQGIYADAPDVGCCTLGAHFADKDDEKRVAGNVSQLTPERLAVPPGPAGEEVRLDRDRRRRRAQDPRHRVRRAAGVRLPQPGATSRRPAARAAPAARSTDSHSSRVGTRSRPSPTCAGSCRSAASSAPSSVQDGTSYTEVSIGEYDRRGWGPGGHDLDWYCSGNTEAHVALEPVFVTHEAELVELMGAAGYAELSRHCEAHVRSRSALALHPADPR